jgi:3-oxoacyl-[acyl-carrier protein] reductase
MRLQDRVAIITGAAQGIGEAIARRFAREGARVVICDLNEDKIRQVEKEINDNAGTALGIVVNVADRAEVNRMVDETVKAFGTVDILVNNAGITRDAMSHRMTEDQWDLVLNVNLKGTFNCCQAVLPLMREKSAGRIINLSSAGRFGVAGQVNYAASKAGVVGLTRTLAKELGARGILVNAIAPGMIATEMYAAVPEEITRERLKNVPLNRLGTVDEVASACIFLASDEASYITGQVIHVDGGRYMP